MLATHELDCASVRECPPTGRSGSSALPVPPRGAVLAVWRTSVYQVLTIRRAEARLARGASHHRPAAERACREARVTALTKSDQNDLGALTPPSDSCFRTVEVSVLEKAFRALRVVVLPAGPEPTEGRIDHRTVRRDLVKRDDGHDTLQRADRTPLASVRECHPRG